MDIIGSGDDDRVLKICLQLSCSHCCREEDLCMLSLENISHPCPPSQWKGHNKVILGSQNQLLCASRQLKKLFH